jgi:hypothetical protein
MHPSDSKSASRSPECTGMPRGSAVTCLGRPADQAFWLRRQARAVSLKLGFPALAAGYSPADKLTAIPRTRNVESFS